MALFKCKMCGGDLQIDPGATVVQCEYCGTSQTLPKLDDERRANLYDRANHFRRNNDFDKAMGIYEQILSEDNTDAEAYWSLVLCRYGIEYVEDPATRKRLPTVNRAQFTAIFDDDNYKSALEYADFQQRAIYEAEARTINEIQKGILAISQKEDPFDVFICYKESDHNGRRTPDSVLANDLYHQLIQEGFKVFFSRITLEDKLGTAYEPYIFAALNSAKVMVVLGTKPEYFKAVWVRNEWSRYLGLIKQGQKKMLIPAYKDMDPYDLPEEFSHLQAQDMSKLGFMQDLIRGIKKIVQVDVPQMTVVKETVVTAGNTNTAPLLKRAFMFLEDGDWGSANEYCEKVLDQDPECAQAYLGKLMAQLQVKKQEQLKDCAQPFDGNNNYQKAIRFGDDNLKSTLSGYITYINERNEKARLEQAYQGAVQVRNTARTEQEYAHAAQRFEQISVYKDAAAQAALCREKAEAARKDAILAKSKSRMFGYSVVPYEGVIRQLEQIAGWKDADQQIAICKQKIQEIQAREEAEEQERAKNIKQKKLTAAIVIPSIIVAIAFLVLLFTVIIPSSKYNNAVALMNSGSYEDAFAIFEDLGNYKDSSTKAAACNAVVSENKYNTALSLVKSGDYVAAYDVLIALDGYKDSAEQADAIYSKYTAEKIKAAKIGDYVVFGKYEQDNNYSNGKEAIEWRVLDIQDGKALVISKYALDRRRYTTDYTSVTWKNSTLRRWLNEDFINAAFTEDDKAMIPTMTVTDSSYNNDSSNTTQDQVFLLSVDEVNQYFISEGARKCEPTAYAIAQGAYADGTDGNCWWWLRTFSYSGSQAYAVHYVGVVYTYSVSSGNFAVRPALWINLNA